MERDANNYIIVLILLFFRYTPFGSNRVGEVRSLRVLERIRRHPLLRAAQRTDLQAEQEQGSNKFCFGVGGGGGQRRELRT